jgi:hypothetical protein
MKKHLRLLAELAPDYAQFHRLDNGVVLKINRALGVAAVKQKLRESS